jgi:hypothetical protein
MSNVGKPVPRPRFQLRISKLPSTHVRDDVMKRIWEDGKAVVT